MAEFEPEVISDPAIQALLKKVKVRPSERFTSQYPAHWGCEMRVILQDGSVYETEVRDPAGSVHRPLTREQVMEKARGLLKEACPGREEQVINQLLTLAQADRLPEIR